MNIVKQVWEKFQRVTELTLEMLETGIDFLSFQEKLRQELNNLGQEILKEVIEEKDTYLREHPEERPGWQIERRDDAKTVLTIFWSGKLQADLLPAQRDWKTGVLSRPFGRLWAAQAD